MAESPKQERAEVDTTLPFRSVRDALNMFGEAANARKYRASEKPLEELAKVREHVKHVHEGKSQVLSDLTETTVLSEGINQEVQYRNTSKEALNGVESFKSDCEEEEKSVEFAEQKEVSKQPIGALSELELVKRELRNWRQEILECQEVGDFAVMVVAETNSTTKGEVFAQILPTNKSLMPLCLETNKQGSALLVVKIVEECVKQSQELETSDQSLNASKHLEERMGATTDELRELRAELVAAMEYKEKFARETVRAVATLKEVRSQLEIARQSEDDAVSCAALLSSELQEAKKSLMNALDTAISLKIGRVSYQDEVQHLRKDIAEFRDKEAFASAAIASLTVELNQIKAELAGSAVAEDKANDTISYLTKALEQAKSEAEEAKFEADAMRKEVQEDRSAAEQAEGAMDAAERKSRACSSNAHAEKSSKTIAVDQNKAMFVEAIAVSASTAVDDAGFLVSQEEYDALKRKLEETEKLASVRVAAALADVEVVRNSEQEIQQKLRTSNEELEVMRKTVKQAFHKVEMAEAAKSAIEGELRRLRQREQRRKERRVIPIVQQSIEQTYISSEGDQSFSFGTTHITPLGTVLNMKVPSAGEHKKMEKSVTQKKKKNILPPFGGYLVRK